MTILYYKNFKPYKIEPFLSSLTLVSKMLITSYFSMSKLFNLITYVRLDQMFMVNLRWEKSTKKLIQHFLTHVPKRRMRFLQR